MKVYEIELISAYATLNTTKAASATSTKTAPPDRPTKRCKTEKVRSGFLVFPKHYHHLLEKVDAITTICFNFCYEIPLQSQKYHRNNDQNLSATL